MEFSRTHVFSFSARQGTDAAGMSGQVPAEVKKLRSNRMIELARDSLEKYQNHFLGSTQEVLFEQFSDGYCSGYTDTYIRVYIKNGKDLSNCIVKVNFLRAIEEGIEGAPA
jgi:threonylcarbamoyladenosine tRNA methylthiotransferase MtaB